MEAELSGLLLDCLAWGTAPEALPFPGPAGAPVRSPRPASLLGDLGALAGGIRSRRRVGAWRSWGPIRGWPP